MNFVDINWNNSTYVEFLDYLKAYQDIEYRKFHSHLIPDCSSTIIGVRTPVLRKIGCAISKGNAGSFLNIAGNEYYEEIIIQGIVIGLIKANTVDELFELMDSYAPLVDNWATCDLFCSSFKEVKKHREAFLPKITEYICSENPWYIRIALVLLLTYYLDDKYLKTALNLADSVKCEHYYVSMAQAWLVATAFSKNESVTFEFFCDCKLDNITYNRAIQKAKDSYRVSKSLKKQLSQMRRTLDKN